MRWRHGLRSAVAVVGVVALVSGATTARAVPTQTVAAPRQSLVVYNPPATVAGVPTYGANQPVELLGGFLPVFAGCLDPLKNDVGPVVVARSDILVQRRGGGPKVRFSISALGGLNLGTVVGHTGPSGAFATGVYDVVYDECQDGNYDELFDARFTEAFRVVVPVDAPIIDLGAGKETAQEVADTAEAAEEILGVFGQVQALGRLRGGSGSPRDALEAIGGPAAGWAAVSDPTGPPSPLDLGLPLLREYAQRLASDPPDPAYAQPTTVRRRSPTAARGDFPDLAAASEASSAAAIAADLAEALVQAVERYQGAAADRDGHWALVHARELRQFAAALDDQLAALVVAVDAWAAAVRAAPPVDPELLSDLAAASNGLTDVQRRALRNNGFSRSEIGRIERELGEIELSALSPDEVTTRTGAFSEALAGWRTALSELAIAAGSAEQALLGDPNTGVAPPAVAAGGPYTGNAGGTMRLEGTTSGDAAGLTFRWDLDGDGLFDDAEGASPTVGSGPVGRRLIALQATDEFGQQAFAYAATTVNQATTEPVPAATPAASSIQTIALGQQLDFTVASGQPTRWLLDGAPVAAGAAYRYAPTRLADAGTHLLTALVGDESARPARLDWLLRAQAPDGDGDGWHANVDCDDARGAINPGQPERSGDGLDNDCDPLTADGDAEPGVTLAYPDFSSIDGLVLNGATQVGSVLRVTDNQFTTSHSVWAATPVSPASSFSSTFDVFLHDGSSPPADGIVFVLQASPAGTASRGGEGGGIGYSGITPSVAVEFDTWRNDEPDNNHVAIHLNGDERTPTAIAPAPFPLYGSPFQARVDYDAGTKTLSVFVGQGETTPATPLLSATVDIASTLGTEHPAYAGFTGGTGIAWEQADLRSWRFEGARGTGPAAAPPTVPELVLSTPAGEAVTTTLQASAPAGAATSYALAEPPAHGTAVISGDRLTYTPDRDVVGSDTFAYTATSTIEGQSRTSAPAVARVTITPTPSAPVISPIPAITTSPEAVATRDVLASAPGASFLTLTASDLPAFTSFQDLGNGRGLLTADGAHATPGPYTATITATSEAGTTSATVEIIVPGNRPPVMGNLTATTRSGRSVTVQAEATDPDGDELSYALRTPPGHGTVTASGASFTYQPDPGFDGTDAFVVAASDGRATTTSSVTVTVERTRQRHKYRFIGLSPRLKRPGGKATLPAGCPISFVWRIEDRHGQPVTRLSAVLSHGFRAAGARHRLRTEDGKFVDQVITPGRWAGRTLTYSVTLDDGSRHSVRVRFQRWPRASTGADEAAPTGSCRLASHAGSPHSQRNSWMTDSGSPAAHGRA